VGQAGKIVRVSRTQKTSVFPELAVYDFTHMTVMPDGSITRSHHVALWPQRRIEDKSETPSAAGACRRRHAYATLMAGFTTIQSVGSPEIKSCGRPSIGRGAGPRLLTSLEPIEDPKLTPERFAKLWRKLKADGANLVKIFASRSIRQGGRDADATSNFRPRVQRPRRRGCERW